MRKTILSICTAIYTIAICAAENYTEYVNPLMGTESSFELSAGNTYPAIARPWGMNFWTPQTGKMGDGWTYTYSADKLRGFKQTHFDSTVMVREGSQEGAAKAGRCSDEGSVREG